MIRNIIFATFFNLEPLCAAPRSLNIEVRSTTVISVIIVHLNQTSLKHTSEGTIKSFNIIVNQSNESVYNCNMEV